MPHPWLFHVDMDMFLAAVEILRRPELAGLPVVVGGRGDPTERGVVSTASYEAREFGVRSGMPLRTALKRCPEAVFLPVDFPTYEAASAKVMAALRAHPGARVEVLGWDEAFVEVATDDPIAEAHALRGAVLAASDLHCSVGIGDTLVRAKMATDLGKPRGVSMLRADNWFDVFGDRPTQALWGVGPKFSARLAGLGLETVRSLAAADVDALVAEFGPAAGHHLAQLARGEGRRTVDESEWVARAHGHETTFQTDLTDRTAVLGALTSLAEQVIGDLEREGRACQRVFLKVRFAPFFTVNRSRKLPEPTLSAARVAEVATALYDALDDDRPVRLLGIRGEMVPPEGGY